MPSLKILQDLASVCVPCGYLPFSQAGLLSVLECLGLPEPQGLCIFLLLFLHPGRQSIVRGRGQIHQEFEGPVQRLVRVQSKKKRKA